MSLYPINLNITDQLCVVIGGGAVATRKVKNLLRCHARIRIISPQLTANLQGILPHPSVEWWQRPFQPGDLQGAALAFALTDNPQIQAQISQEAKAHSILLNVADNPQACTFQTPACICRGDLLITISTGGHSPTLSSIIRQELEVRYGTEYEKLVDLLGDIRRQMLSSSATGDTPQSELVHAILQTGILQLFKERDHERIQQKLREILPENINIAHSLNRRQRD